MPAIFKPIALVAAFGRLVVLVKGVQPNPAGAWL
jgi:hypothetical protein